MISRGKLAKVPSLTGIYSGSFSVDRTLTTEQTVLSITGSAGKLGLLSVADTIPANPSYHVTLRLKVDGVTVFTNTKAWGSGTLTDILAATTTLRGCFPAGLDFRDSLEITAQFDTGAGSGAYTCTYVAHTTDGV